MQIKVVLKATLCLDQRDLSSIVDENSGNNSIMKFAFSFFYYLQNTIKWIHCPLWMETNFNEMQIITWRVWDHKRDQLPWHQNRWFNICFIHTKGLSLSMSTSERSFILGALIRDGDQKSYLITRLIQTHFKYLVCAIFRGTRTRRCVFCA